MKPIPQKKLDCVLLIDDDKATNFVNQFLIKKTGITDNVVTLLNGKEAIEYIKENCKKNNSEIDVPVSYLIFLDINMPVMNGWEFLCAFQKITKNLKDNIVIVLLTSSSNPDDMSNAKDYLEVSEYIKKPITKEKIKNIVENYFSEVS